jgi:hypothetical protein
MLNQANANLDDLTTRARAELHHYRNLGRTDEQFVLDLIDRFTAAAHHTHSDTAGWAQMAVTVYRLAVQQDRIDALLDLYPLPDPKDTTP